MIKKFNDFINESINDKIEYVSTSSLEKLRTQTKDINYELSDEIEKFGILEPLTVVYHVHDNKAALSDGHHRLDVATYLGIDKVPVQVITSGTDAPKNAVKIENAVEWKYKDYLYPHEIGLV